MSNLRLDYEVAKLATTLMILVFPLALVVVMLSGVNLRQRSERRACRQGAAEACLAVGRFYEDRSDGLFAFLLSNPNTASDHYDRACKLGNLEGCARFGYLTVVSRHNTYRDDFSSSQGLEALDKACSGGDRRACQQFVGAVEPGRAAPVLARLCDAGDAPACNQLIEIYFESEPKRAIELLDRTCAAGDDGNCRYLARAYLGGSRVVEADPPRGIALLTRVCDRGAWGGCRDLAEAYLDGRLPADPARAAALLTRACDHGDLDACFDLGRSLVDSDADKAVQVFTAECDRDARGCDALGDLYRVGLQGLARDRGRAYAMYEQACRQGSDFDCFKRDCMSGDQDHCARVLRDQRDRRFRLGGRFDMR